MLVRFGYWPPVTTGQPCLSILSPGQRLSWSRFECVAFITVSVWRSHIAMNVRSISGPSPLKTSAWSAAHSKACPVRATDTSDACTPGPQCPVSEVSGWIAKINKCEARDMARWRMMKRNVRRATAFTRRIMLHKKTAGRLFLINVFFKRWVDGLQKMLSKVWISHGLEQKDELW